MSFFYPEMSSARPPRIFWSLLILAIVLAAETAAALAYHAISDQDMSNGMVFYIAAPLAALLVGLPSWWFYVVEPRRATVLRGFTVGALGSLVTLLLVGMLFGPFWYIAVFLAGWATTPIGGTAGIILVYFQRTLTHFWPLPTVSQQDDIPCQARVSKHSQASVALPHWVFWLLLGLGYGLLSEVTALLFSHFVTPQSLYYLAIAGPLASPPIGVLIWWRFMVRSGRATIWRGICTGVLGNTVAYPFIGTCYLLSSQPSSSNSSVYMLTSLLFMLWENLILLGWITAPIGGIAGGLFFYLQRALTASQGQNNLLRE